MLASLLVEQRLGAEDVAPRGPRVRRSPGDHAVTEVLCGDAAVVRGQLELVTGLLEEAGSVLPRVAHDGNSGGQGIGVLSGNRAYACAGSEVSSSTPAPCFSAPSFTG